jgi:hypothetical protein
MCVLGSILQSPGEAIAKCVEKITAEHFFNPVHRTIYTALCDMWDAGEAIDLITFTQFLRDRNLHDQVGGSVYVTELATFVPTAANVASYIDIVCEKYVLRETRCAAEIAIRRTNDAQGEPEMVLSELQSRLASLHSLHGKNGSQDFSIRSATEILELKLDEYDCLFGDRLLAKGGKLVIAGAAGIGKSRLLLQLAVATITGRDLCGIETHAKGLRWLILQTENSNRRLQFELRALTHEFGKDFLDSLFIHTIETDADGFVALDNPSAVRRMEAAIHKYQPGIVGVDPLRDFRIGNLDTDADMTSTCEALGHIVRAGNSQRAVVAVHHALTGKAGASKATGYERSGFARNSKALLSWARAQINIAPGNPDDNDLLVIACGKNNDGKEFPPFAVRLNPDTMIYGPDESFGLEEWRAEVSGAKVKRRFSPELLRDLKFKELEIKPLAKLVSDQTGAGRSRAYELIHEAKECKILRFNKTLQTYAKTNQ